MTLFNKRGKEASPPVWFMRQAGRYHSHYQQIRKQHGFMGMCKDPELACEITMGPIQDFDFDAAILFSDLLFPLEQLGLGLDYDAGPPRLARHLDNMEAIDKLQPNNDPDFYLFQKQALQKLKIRLPAEKTLLGFVGAPWTLYTYAVEGQHAGNLLSSKRGLFDGRFQRFAAMLLESLEREMDLQAEGGADAICIFDTAAGELSVDDYAEYVAPLLRKLAAEFKSRHPEVRLLYYSKLTHLQHYKAVATSDFDALGFDWRHDIAECLNTFGPTHFVQGNIDPAWLFLPWSILENKVLSYYRRIHEQTNYTDKWIFGLGHGVLPGTPEDNVRRLVDWLHSRG